MAQTIRINKYLADKGLTTRRGADVLIAAGGVFVNGNRASLGMQVSPGDRITIANNSAPSYDYILYYKPRGVITHSPAAHETDIVTQIKKDHRITGVFPIGRLDKDSEGLILLTNDGRVTKRLLDPAAGREKEYRVQVNKRVTGTFLNRMIKGVYIEGYRTKPAQATIDPQNELIFTITLFEGKKHQIRRMCAAMGYQVVSLIRTRIMDLTLRKLQSGQFHRLQGNELSYFLKSLNIPVTSKRVPKVAKKTTTKKPR